MKIITSILNISKQDDKKIVLKPEIWKRLPIELYLDIKDIFLDAVKNSYLKRPCVRLRIRIDIFQCVSFYFGLH